MSDKNSDLIARLRFMSSTYEFKTSLRALVNEAADALAACGDQPTAVEVQHAGIDLDAIRTTIQHAREDAEGWYNAARPLTGRQHFSFAGAGRMLNDVADAAEKLLAALGDTVPREQYEQAVDDREASLRRSIDQGRRVVTAERKRDEARADRDALAHVIDQAPHQVGCTLSWVGGVGGAIVTPCTCWKSTAPDVSLALHDAEVKEEAWDEGWNERQRLVEQGVTDNPGHHSKNPYRN